VRIVSATLSNCPLDRLKPQIGIHAPVDLPPYYLNGLLHVDLAATFLSLMPALLRFGFYTGTGASIFAYQGLADLMESFTALMFLTPSLDSHSSKAFTPSLA